ncbi:tetracycline resistance protein from transposon [Purpureocillium lavendulum]|uniref:Tetracycline resistance protein from transposon n=1 Tax=Purpureocillium lavendulum TaxID=1247861 RepID=A0AB34FPS8_9HYPO|nr:tetracycline resistance protein from transposon [Purpureocillium lavendulum]
MTAIKVAIIGAGPSGCMLARMLHLGGVDVTVFEGEASPDFRGQGGTLDLHTKTGLAAMSEAGLFEEFEKHARYDGQYAAVVDKNLKYHMVRGVEDRSLGERPEIDRSRLREILINSLPTGMVRWGHRLKAIEGKTLVFGNTTASGFDLVVGADGAWSKVRQAIDPDFQPQYTGVAMTELNIPDAESTAPEIHKIVNRGSIFASNEGQRVSYQQMGDGSICIYASTVRTDPDWMDPEKCGYDTSDLESTKRALELEFKDWCPPLREALSLAQGRCIPRSLHILPIAAKWKHRPGVTLIGDAAHLMTPHAGEGVNQALEDAMLLARTIVDTVDSGNDIDDEVVGFEEAMRARVGPVQQLAYDLCQCWMFTPGAPKSVMPKVISRHVQSQAPLIMQPLLVAGVHAYFFVKYMLWP